MKLIVLALACLVAIASAQINCQNTDIVVDDFTVFRNSNTTGGFDKLELIQGVDTTLSNTHPITGAAGSFLFKAETFPTPPGASSHILGGYRDTIIYIDQNSSPLPSPGQGVRLNINVGPDTTGTTRSQLRYSTDQGITGVAEIQWDGNTDSGNPRNFVRTGLGGIDLTLAGASDSFTLDLQDTDLPVLLRVEAWSYAGGNAANSRGVFLEWSPSAQGREEFKFSEFLPIGAAVDSQSVFQSLGAMRVFITQQPDNRASEIDLVVFSVSIANRYCLLKAAASGTASTITGKFNLFTGPTNQLITSNNCANSPVAAGTRVTFIVQAYIENVDTSVLTITDVIDQRFALIPSSVTVYNHLTPATQLTTSIVSTANNRIQVQINVLQADVTSYVSVFFEVNVLATGVSSETCQVVVPNRATLASGAISLNSFNYNGVTATDAPTRICITASPTLTFTQSSNAANPSEAGDSFTITNNIRNTGLITANSVQLICTLDSVLTFASSAEWTVNGNVYTRNLGSLPVESSARVSTHQVIISEDAEDGTYTVRCCINTVGSSLPAYCLSEACSSLTVTVASPGIPDVKIHKRGHLIRELHYDIDFFNPCADAATDVVVSEVIPEGTTFNEIESDDRWECVDGVCTVDVGTLPANASGCAPFVVTIDEDTPPCAVHINYAVVEASNDRDDSNNDDSVIIIEPGCYVNDCIGDCLAN